MNLPVLLSGPVLLIAGVGVAGVAWQQPEFSTESWDLISPNRELAKCQQQDEALVSRSQDVLYRIGVKDCVVQQLIDGQISLREAAARFRELNSVVPAHMSVLRRSFPGKSDEEVLSRNVLSFVSTALQRRPEDAAHVMGRLEAELQSQVEEAASRHAPAP